MNNLMYQCVGTTGPMESHFVRGEHTLRVPMSLFRENRERLVQRLRSNLKVPKKGAYVVLQGGEEIPFNDTDISWPFRQESYFQWCFGVEEPNCYGIIDVTSGESILFFPRLPPEYAVWQGHLYTTEDFRERYAVNRVYYTDQIADVLNERGDVSLLLTLHGINSDSGLVAREAVFDNIGQFKVNNELLYPEISECIDAEGSVAPRRPRLLSRSSIFVQDGTLVHEVPLIVRKITDPSILCVSNLRPVEKKNLTIIEKSKTKGRPSRGRKKNRRIDIETEDGTAVLFGSDLDFLKEADVDQLLESLESCYTPKGIFSLLETMILEEINSIVALQALKKIIDVENGPANRNRSSLSSSAIARNRDAVMSQIVEMIACAQDNEMILEALSILARDFISPTVNALRNRLSDEVASRVADEELSIIQITKAVAVIARFKSPEYQEAVDSLWIGLSAKENDVTVENIVPLFKTLALFDKSRKLVQAVLERNLTRLFDQLTGRHVADILKILSNASIESPESLKLANKWLAQRADNLDRKDLIDLIRTWTTTRYSDPAVEKILQLHVGPGRRVNEDPALIAAIMNYCGTTRLRNHRILHGCAEWLSRNARRISPGSLASLFVPFGTLNFRPSEPVASRFWSSLEDAIAAKFGQLKPDEALDILLAFVYLEHHPIRFVGKVFRANFLDRLQHRRNVHLHDAFRNKLRLFDAAMTLECHQYAGPMIQTDEKTAENIQPDQRLARVANQVYHHLAKVIDGEKRVAKNAVLAQLPNNALYVMDALIHPVSVEPHSSQIFNLEKFDRNISTAVFVHLPEHFCMNSRHLVGPQSMRKRHFRKLGFRVMTLDYDTLVKLIANPPTLVKYVKQRFLASEEAL